MESRNFFEKIVKWVDGEYSFLDADLYIQQKKPPKKIDWSQVFSVAKIRDKKRLYPFLCVTSAIIFIAVLLMMVSALPQFGEANNPIHNEVMERYIEQGVSETGATNFVSGMVLEYRAFDTFAEMNVLFISLIASIALLRKSENHPYLNEERELQELEWLIKNEKEDILKMIVKYLNPMIMLYGIQIMMTGHLSPGGGFAGGAIIGGALILYGIVFGQKRMHTFLSMKRLMRLNVVSIFVYTLVKYYSFFTGANNVGFEIPKGVPGALFSAYTILILNICIGVLVACTMYGFYALFARGEI
ncbi:MAG: hydrogen gas-evolving membrane-bound hydrogenase subunit E [Bacillota bacterium]